MCDLCKKHAEKYGKWYLNPKGYSRELFEKLSLLDKILRRPSKKVREVQKTDTAWFPLEMAKLLDMVDWSKKPIVGPLVKMIGNWALLRAHAGQVVPLEDAYKIVVLSYGHVVFPCMCKRLFKGDDEYKCLNFAPLTDINRKRHSLEDFGNTAFAHRRKFMDFKIRENYDLL